LRIETDPQRDRLDLGVLASDRGPALRGQASGAAAVRPQLQVLPEAREGLRPDAVAPHDPGALALEPRVDQIGVGDVLEPARHRIQATAGRPVGVGDSRAHPALEDPAAWPVHELRQLCGRTLYLSSSSESRNLSIIDQRSGIWSRSET